MKPLIALARASLWWLLPLAVLVALVGYETGFGRAMRKVPPPPPQVEPKPVTVALLPEYAIAGGIGARRETVDRTLFTPTRRPAPALVAEAVKPKMQRGQFALTGTMIVDGKSTAFLRETNGGRSRRVTQGETVNGMVVAEVKPDRVKLTLADESEELLLKVTTNPRPTPQPAIAAVPVQPHPAGVPQPAPVAAAPAPAVPPAEAAATLAERRRAVRAAQAAAQAATSTPDGNPIPAQPSGSAAALPPAPAPAAAPPQPRAQTTTPDPRWNDVYQRYQYRTR
jgi:hypothetical protein